MSPSPACSLENCFAVFKCGPHWGRTATVSSASPVWNWEVRPLFPGDLNEPRTHAT